MNSRALLLFILLVSTSSLAWPKKDVKPDATQAECKAEGKLFVKAMVRKNGVKVRAHCRALPKVSP